MDLAEEVSWLRLLAAPSRASFLARLSHDITIVIRALCTDRSDLAATIERIRLANEIEHRITSYLSHCVEGKEDPRWIDTVVRSALAVSDDELRRQVSKIWQVIRQSI